MGIALITNNILSDSGTAVAGLVPTSRTISTTAPLTGGGDLSADRTIAIPAATSSVNGYLTSADWTTFNSKQAALSGTGFVKISGTTISYDNSTYLTTSQAASTYLPLSGGTLTGALSGTSATFKGIGIFDNSASGDANSGIRIVAPIGTTHYNWMIGAQQNVNTGFEITPSTTVGGTTFSTPVLTILQTGAATFTGSVTSTLAYSNTSDLSFVASANIPGYNLRSSAGGRLSIVTGYIGADISSILVGTGTNNPSTEALRIVHSSGAATFSSSVTAGGRILTTASGNDTFGFQMYKSGTTTTLAGFYQNTTGDGLIAAYNSAGTQNVQIATNGVSYFNGGNVGIGTTSPGYKLDIQSGQLRVLSGNSSNPALIIGEAGGAGTTNQGTLQFGDANSSFKIQGGNDYVGMIFTCGSERMRITSGGTLLVNATSANGYGGIAPKLEVYGTSVGSSDSDGGTLALLGNTNTADAGGALVFGGNTTSFYATWGRIRAPKDNATSGNYAGGLAFDTRQNSSNFTERMRITSSGNVGIGTTSPQVLLQIGEGSLSNTTTNQYLRVNAGVYNAASTSNLDLFNFGNNFGNALGWRLTSGTEGVGVSVGRYLSFNTVVTDGSGNPSTATERMRIASGGNVLIGTTTDAGYKLNVNGQIYSGAITSSGSVTATSFFESSDATIKTLITDNYQAKGIESVVAKLYTKNGKEELGYYAQDVQGILPSAVSKGTDGLLSLSYREVHTAKIARLEKEVEELKAQLARL